MPAFFLEVVLTRQLVWFRQDLRLHDHPALSAAMASGSVIPVYILDDDTPGEQRMGAAQRWWLHHSLLALGKNLTVLGAPLILRRGRSSVELARLAIETGAAAIHALHHYEPWWQVAQEETGKHVPLILHEGNQLANPRSILKDTGERYRVFTPWFSKLQQHMPPPAPTPRPERIVTPEAMTQSDDLDTWGLLPRSPDWASCFAGWVPGERGARAALKSFLPILADYEHQRNYPSRAGVSRLSPHIHFGEISPSALWHHAARAAGPKARVFQSEIAWREHGLNLVDQFPDYAWRNGRSLFDRFPWRTGSDAEADFRAWTKGMTGYPVVDAGMRELWQTGWMHNRVRMITASFLVKHLLIDWRRGERWFWDTLLDADLGANAMNWQYVAGSGVDAPVFSRMMAPFVQSPKFEMADYIRRFVPELAHMRDDEIHAPHEKGLSPPSYPLPIISHGAARDRAMAAWSACRGE
jgi:deoxyribodipyrimidine photo-lyase